MDLAGLDTQVVALDGANAAEMLAQVLRLQHHPWLGLRAQKLGQGQAFVNLALTHGRGIGGRRVPTRAQLGPNTRQALWREDDEAYKHQPKPE